VIRSIWVYVMGSLVTLWVGGGVALADLIRSRRMKRVCHNAPRRWSRGILWAAGTRVEFEGLERLTRGGPQVLVANHESFFDVFALAAHLPVDYRFVAKEELGRIPVFGHAWKTCGHISINRGDRTAAVGSLDQAGQRIRDENVTIIMFPEGTRSPSGQLQSFKKGAFVLAIQMGVPVVPVGIVGSRHVLPKPGWPVRKGTIHIRIGEPIPVDGLGISDRDSLMKDAWEQVAILKGEKTHGTTELPIPGEPTSGNGIEE
jgi:1-acyl-sn-glycerol-3-phosphate acyltransferase